MEQIPGGYRALVVDDEAPLAEVIASYLTREQFEVTVAHDGTEAVRLAARSTPTWWSSTSACRASTAWKSADRCARSPTPMW